MGRLHRKDWAGMLIAMFLFAIGVSALASGAFGRLRYYGGAVAVVALALWWGWSLLWDDGEVTQIKTRMDGDRER